MDSYEYTQLKHSLTAKEIKEPLGGAGEAAEHKQMFHEWATVQPGMICLSRKKRTAQWRQYTAAETATPVIACAAGLPKNAERNFYFSGVARSKSVREPDDGIGPKTDEFFTLSIGGMVTVTNTSGDPLHPGDLVEWCLANERGTANGKRQKQGPRRIAIQLASVSSPNVIGQERRARRRPPQVRPRTEHSFFPFSPLCPGIRTHTLRSPANPPCASQAINAQFGWNRANVCVCVCLCPSFCIECASVSKARTHHNI